MTAMPSAPDRVNHAAVHLPAATSDAAGLRRRELAAFLRSRRERLRPEELGLPSTGRRRTPGLRREEVAAAAGVGVTWYTWLEQARNVTPSVQVLDALARALLLDPHERTHLFILAGTSPVRAPEPAREVSPQVDTLLRKVEPFPAVVTNARYDMVAYNATYRYAIADLDAVPPEERNMLWLLFCHPEWIASGVDRPEVLRRVVGQFRAAMAEHMNDPAWKCLVRRLRTHSAEFAELWERHEVRGTESTVKTVISPRVGVVRFHLTHLWLDERLSHRLNLYTPADEETLEKVTRLASAVA